MMEGCSPFFGWSDFDDTATRAPAFDAFHELLEILEIFEGRFEHGYSALRELVVLWSVVSSWWKSLWRILTRVEVGGLEGDVVGESGRGKVLWHRWVFWGGWRVGCGGACRGGSCIRRIDNGGGDDGSRGGGGRVGWLNKVVIWRWKHQDVIVEWRVESEWLWLWLGCSCEL
jgi:hypothetical protein